MEPQVDWSDDGLSPDADAALMVRVAVAGCSHSFERLASTWRPRIERLCFRLCGNLADAEDLTQEIFEKLFRSRERYRPEARFSTFLWRIATNHCRDFARARRRRPAIEASERLSDIATARPDGLPLENREVVQQAVWCLPERFRTVLVLRHYEHMKFGEIAELLEVPRGTVASRMAKALRLLEVELIRQRLLPAAKPSSRFARETS
jgi:RNA polymerase sigma-70 factor (ECF subfamily)